MYACRRLAGSENTLAVGIVMGNFGGGRDRETERLFSNATER